MTAKYDLTAYPAYTEEQIQEVTKNMGDYIRPFVQRGMRRAKKYKCRVSLRNGATEWSALPFVKESVIQTLEHGKTYTIEELGINPFFQRTILKFPQKVQFFVEYLDAK